MPLAGATIPNANCFPMVGQSQPKDAASDIPATGSSARILVGVSASPGADGSVKAAHRLAKALGTDWEAVHIVTPAANRKAVHSFDAAEALGLAAELGASVVRLPAATVADGLMAHLITSPATDLVLGSRHPKSLARRLSGSPEDQLRALGFTGVIHLVPVDGERPARTSSKPSAPTRRSYVEAAGGTALTAALALLLSRWLGNGALNLLFLFPVIAAGTRSGIRPALLAAALSVISANVLLIQPAYQLHPNAPQSWVLMVVLSLVAVYTGLLTGQLRDRVALSDRSARENANLAAFALELTRVSDWSTTGEVVCAEFAKMLDVHAVLFREIAGELVQVASVPSGAVLSPLDAVALDWAWANEEQAGSGTDVLGDTNWQFQPLKTSLGVLAVVGLAREDGRSPVRADQAVLLSTLTAQAALAHERLLLEDEARVGDSDTHNSRTSP